MKAIIVFYDSLNKRYLPPYGSTDVIAPNFERLAKHSVTFDQSYVGSMPCIPARRELHTGRLNLFHREWGPLEPFDDSMPEILKKHGVYTHLISDHLHYWEDGGATYHPRYSSWEIVRGQEGDHWKGQVAEPVIPEVVTVPEKTTGNGPSGLWRYDWVNRKYITKHEDFPQYKVFELGCEFIDQNHQEENWLLQVETFDPHEPFYAPKEFLDMYPDTSYQGKHFDWPRGEAVQSEDEINHVRRQYKALVSMCDYHLGKILDKMDEYDMWKDTLLIVGTDHGFLLGEHKWWGKNKMPYFNEISNTPLFVWDPRSSVKDERRESIVQLIDWAPTLYDYFNVSIPKDVMGKPMKHVIERDEKIRDSAIFGAFSAHINVTDGEMTYMCAPEYDKKDEIFNYTLMPLHMGDRFTKEEMSKAEFVEGFSFTKGMKVLKVPANDKYGVAHYGNLLFNVHKDPKQETPLKDAVLEMKYRRLLKEHMVQNDAPKELFVRMGLDKE